ncbi:hypothetical protein C8R48DRAFT_598563 [Suillus tomentosus]|nr:hypothetical protein C8R48DRAFT_598563 [Suillus tomentosus]
MFGESLEEEYDGVGASYSQDGSIFLDLFDADEYAECRVDNLYYPFASKEEWEVADYLLHSSLSMAAIDEFLKLSMVSERLLHVYSEWLTGYSAWEMQTQLPRGATVLGTVLSSDKTNITTMTGARVAHPLLLGLANIRMCTHTKLLSKAFLLTALLPIPKYLHPNQQMWGMLEDHLIHKCLSIILKPLMKAAEVGIMMSDPVGNVHHCFTPLAAYIIDTSEAAMLACVRGKTSPFTMASYLQFGDNFWHPARTRSITLGQLANITVNPDDLEAYFEACADSRLNGVYAPFWMDWPLADPSIFLTPESLHHWHKEFYNHDLQWCIVVVGAQELDFWFSILQPTTGYHHFSGGISKLKQVTG